MSLPNALRLLNLLRRKPRLLSLGVNNLRGRIVHPYYKKQVDGHSAPPEQVTVMVTDTCNFRCPMCQYVSSNSPGFRLNQIGCMKPQLFRKLMAEVPGKPLIAFAGGEPLLHPQVDDFIALAHARGHPTWLTTNGWFLAKRAQALCDAKLDFLVVSVDGPPEIHNRIRGDQAFERLTEGIAAILRLPNRPVVFINMAISDLNYGYLIPVYDLAVKLGVDGIDLNHLWMQTDKMVKDFNTQFASTLTTDEVAWNIHPERIDTVQVINAINTIKRRSSGNRLVVMENPHLNYPEIGLWYQQPAQYVKWKSTRCAWNRMRVWPDGSIKACRAWIIGNISQDQVMNVWNGSRMRSFRQTLATHGIMPICARCCDLAHR